MKKQIYFDFRRSINSIKDNFSKQSFRITDENILSFEYKLTVTILTDM